MEQREADGDESNGLVDEDWPADVYHCGRGVKEEGEVGGEGRQEGGEDCHLKKYKNTKILKCKQSIATCTTSSAWWGTILSAASRRRTKKTEREPQERSLRRESGALGRRK